MINFFNNNGNETGMIDYDCDCVNNNNIIIIPTHNDAWLQPYSSASSHQSLNNSSLLL